MMYARVRIDFMNNALEASVPWIEPIESIFGRNPENSVSIFQQACDKVIGQALRVIGVVIEGFEPVAVISVESLLGSYPDESMPILQQEVHSCMRKSITSVKMIETNIPSFRQVRSQALATSHIQCQDNKNEQAPRSIICDSVTQEIPTGVFGQRANHYTNSLQRGE
jgi:hypothetical protein|tara:strand:- start:269 stop:769 length:501 start_codon:yes stop_codon:yes gene_type:complete